MSNRLASSCTNLTLLVSASLALSQGHAWAEGVIDVAAVEYLDVVQTADGSIWTGIITEQAPALHYKLATADGGLRVLKAEDVMRVTRQRNPQYRSTRAVAAVRDVAADEAAEELTTDDVVDATPGQVPARRSGVRLEPELAVVFPSGDLTNLGGSPLSYGASFAPGARVGYEVARGELGLTFGAMLRTTSWQVPSEIAFLGSHSTFETHGYTRAAYHLGRLAPYAALGLGLDINRTRNNLNLMSTTAVGFGMNVQAGVSVAATENASFDVGVDFHPGTDTIDPGVDASVSYYALRFGASFRL